MAVIRGILGDERSTVRVRHAAIASLVAVASLALGMFLIFVGSELYERSSHRVLWALVDQACGFDA
jgi:hypothetical protein